MAQTTVADLILVDVMGDGISKKFGNLIKFAPIAEVDGSLQGQAGTTIIVPFYEYIGDASDVAEGQVVDTTNVIMGSKQASIKKAVKDVAMTDEAVLASNGAIVGEAERQLAVAIANKIDIDALASLKETTLAKTFTGGFTQANLAQAKVAFGEDLEERTVLFINSVNYGKVLSMPEFVPVQGGSAFMSGHVGHVLGLDIIVSDRLADGEALLVRQGALGIAYKRNVSVEAERDMATRSSRVGVDAHYVTYLKDGSKAIKVTIA